MKTVSRLMLSLSLLASSLLNLPVQAQELQLQQLIRHVGESYPPLLEARQKVTSVRGKLLEKQGEFDTKVKGKLEGIPLGYYRQLRLEGVVEQPTPWWGLSLFSGYRLGSGSFADYDGKKETLSLGEIRSGFELPLLRDGAIDPRRADIASLEIQVTVAELEVFAKQLETLEKALKAYWGWIASTQKTEVATQLLNLTSTRVSQLETEIQLGKKPPVDLLENQRALLSRRNKLLESQQKQKEKALELSLYLPADNQSTAPSFPVIDQCLNPRPESAVQQALAQRPERLILHLQQEQNRIGRQLTENQLLPELDLYLVLSQDLGEGDKSRKPLELETGLNLLLPVQQRKVSGVQQQLYAEAQQLEIRDGFLQRLIRTEIQLAETGLQTSCQQVSLARSESEIAQQLASAELARFELGSSDLFLVNLREQAAADARNRLIEAEEAYFFAEGLYYLKLGLLPQIDSARTR